MLKINYVQNLMNSYEILREVANQEITTTEFKKLKKEYLDTEKKKSSTIETLKRLKVLTPTREELVKISLDKPTIVKKTFVNGQLIKNINNWSVKELQKMGLQVRVEKTTTSELEVKKHYYSIHLDKLTKELNRIKKANHSIIKNKISKLQKELKTYENLLTNN